jgi:glycosyltransferase involved in cell wall biosynthesis
VGKVEVAYSSGVDIAGWHRAGTDGIKPGLLPYGLDLMSASGHEISTVSIPRVRSASSILMGLPSQLRAKANGNPTRLIWDERTALDSFLMGRRSNFVSGIVWVTDDVEQTGRSGIDIALKRFVLRSATATWCLSSAQIAPTSSWLGMKTPAPHHVLFGIDETFFTYAPPSSDELVFSVGGDRDRDAKTLFRAMAIVKANQPTARVVVQTTSPLTPPDGIEVVRRLTHVELREMYRKSSVVAVATLPNLHVSGMTVSLEAASTGRPVVITETPGMSDYVSAGRTGTLVPTGDADSLAAEVIRLLRDPTAADEMGRRAREYVVGRHTSRLMAARLSEIVSQAQS